MQKPTFHQFHVGLRKFVDSKTYPQTYPLALFKIWIFLHWRISDAYFFDCPKHVHVQFISVQAWLSVSSTQTFNFAAFKNDNDVDNVSQSFISFLHYAYLLLSSKNIYKTCCQNNSTITRKGDRSFCFMQSCTIMPF